MSLKELVTLIVAIPTFLFLSAIFPPAHLLFVVVWLFCLGFDLHSTYSFYLENPSQFQNNECNKLFVWLTKKVGFKKATIFFPIVIEIPLLLFFAFLPLQILHTYLFPNTSNSLIACIMASFGICAIGHLQAALKNTKLNRKQQQIAMIAPKQHSRGRYTKLCRHIDPDTVFSKQHSDCVVMQKLCQPLYTIRPSSIILSHTRPIKRKIL